MWGKSLLFAAFLLNPRNTSPFSVLEFQYRILEFENRDTDTRVFRVPFSRNSVDPQTETRALRGGVGGLNTSQKT